MQAANDIAQYDYGSFKDPCGRIVYLNDEVYRVVSSDFISFWREVIQSQGFAKIRPYLVETEIVKTPDAIDTHEPEVLHHRKMETVSYCYEWTPEQFRVAAVTTIQLQIELLKNGLTLKDATPFNILFKDAQARFIDIPSVEKTDLGQSWHAFTEYLENFVYPLMAYSYLGILPAQVGFQKLGKITTEEAAQLFKNVSIFKKGIFKYVRVPHMVRSKAKTSDDVDGTDRTMKVPKEIVINNCEELLKLVRALKFPGDHGHWSDYTQTRTYSEFDVTQKHEFVENFVKSLGPLKKGIDIGANTGEFSRLLNQHCKSVCAVESDIVSAEAIWKAAQQGQQGIHVFTMDFSSPTPAMGWANSERLSFAERFAHSDIVLALAVIHHLRISANVPLDMVFEEFARYGKNLVVEWVPTDDPMVRKLLARKENTYTDYTEEGFFASLEKYFKVETKQKLSQGRLLVGAKRRTS